MVLFNDNKIADGGYYINLDSRTDRRDAVEAQLQKYEITGVERMSAIIDGPYAGCLKSHQAIVRQAIDRNWDSVLILEDDFYVMDPPSCGYTTYPKSYKETMSDVILQSRSVEWDALYFGTILHAPLLKVTQNLGRVQASKTTHAMVIKQSIYEEILSLSYAEHGQIDHYYFTTMQKSKIFLSSFPVLFNHGSPEMDYSDLLGRETTNYNYLLSRYEHYTTDFKEPANTNE